MICTSALSSRQDLNGKIGNTLFNISISGNYYIPRYTQLDKNLKNMVRHRTHRSIRQRQLPNAQEKIISNRTSLATIFTCLYDLTVSTLVAVIPVHVQQSQRALSQ